MFLERRQLLSLDCHTVKCLDTKGANIINKKILASRSASVSLIPKMKTEKLKSAVSAT